MFLTVYVWESKQLLTTQVLRSNGFVILLMIVLALMAALSQLTDRLQEVSSDVELEHILNSNLNRLIIVFFYSTTCQTCERIRPDIMSLSGEMTSHLFLHIDIENGLTTAKKYDLQSLPSFLLFFNKKLLEKVSSVLCKLSYISCVIHI